MPIGLRKSPVPGDYEACKVALCYVSGAQAPESAKGNCTAHSSVATSERSVEEILWHGGEGHG